LTSTRFFDFRAFANALPRSDASPFLVFLSGFGFAFAATAAGAASTSVALSSAEITASAATTTMSERNDEIPTRPAMATPSQSPRDRDRASTLYGSSSGRRLQRRPVSNNYTT
jgi:hypothetical protein